MDRKTYLEMCCECSKLPKGTRNIPTHVPDGLKISVDGISFYPLHYILAFENGQARHYAVLHDLNTSSTLQTNLEKLRGDDDERTGEN